MPLRPRFALPFALAAALLCAQAQAAPAQAVTAPATDKAVTPPANTKAASPMTEADVRSVMTAQGYTGINDVKFKQGRWTADARSADGKHVEVTVDAITGKIVPDQRVAGISRDQVITKLQDAGYTNVHGVEMHSGVWKADANDSSGADVVITLDPDDGHILGSQTDKRGPKK